MPYERLEQTVQCPLSETRVGNGIIQRHRIPLFVAKNGSLFSTCNHHGTRIFICENALVAELRESNIKEGNGWQKGRQPARVGTQKPATSASTLRGTRQGHYRVQAQRI